MGPGPSVLHWRKDFDLKNYRIVMLGLDTAGKTTILYRLKYRDTLETIPTIGFNIEDIQPGRGLMFTVWDFGGEPRIRMLGQHHYDHVDGLIFVVDSADRERMAIVKEAFENVLDSEALKTTPILIIANKQDSAEAQTVGEIADYLDLTSMVGRKWCIKSASAKTGEGLTEAMDELAKMVEENNIKKSWLEEYINPVLAAICYRN